MRKVLFLAIALVASAWVFTSCNPNDPNAPESQIVDPKEVTVQDMIGDWGLDSAFGEFRTGREYERRVYAVTQDHIDGEWSTYTVGNGILTLNIHERDWNQEGEVYIDRQSQLEIVSFDRGLKRAVLKQKDASFTIYDEEPPYESHEVKGECTYYLHILPEPYGKDIAITDENVKGVWFEEYEKYRDGDMLLNKSVTPHYNFDYFGDNHEYMNIMAVEMTPFNAFPHPGYWKFHDGGLEYVEAYSGQTFDDMNWGKYNFYVIEKLTDQFMVLHASWDNGDQYYYMTRTKLTKQDLTHE